MPQVILAAKLLYIWIYNGFVGFAVHAAIKATIFSGDYDQIMVMLLIFFALFGVMLPEFCLLAFPGFRSWIKQGVEDSDGQLNKSDMQDALIIYVSLWAMRIFMAFSVAKMFGVEIDTVSYLSTLMASFGLAGLTVIKSFISKG